MLVAPGASRSESIIASSSSANITAVCGPVDMNFSESFGRDLSAAEFVAASSDAHQARCIVQRDDDLYQAIRQMNALGAEVLVVMQDSRSAAAKDVVGVVTKTDISKNVSSKSALMARDRTLSKVGTPKLASVPATGGGKRLQMVVVPSPVSPANDASIEIQQMV